MMILPQMSLGKWPLSTMNSFIFLHQIYGLYVVPALCLASRINTLSPHHTSALRLVLQILIPPLTNCALSIMRFPSVLSNNVPTSLSSSIFGKVQDSHILYCSWVNSLNPYSVPSIVTAPSFVFPVQSKSPKTFSVVVVLTVVSLIILNLFQVSFATYYSSKLLRKWNTNSCIVPIIMFQHHSKQWHNFFLSPLIMVNLFYYLIFFFSKLCWNFPLPHLHSETLKSEPPGSLCLLSGALSLCDLPAFRGLRGYCCSHSSQTYTSAAHIWPEIWTHIFFDNLYPHWIFNGHIKSVSKAECLVPSNKSLLLTSPSNCIPNFWYCCCCWQVI